MSDQETTMFQRLRHIGDRIQQIAELEARGAIVRSGAADGSLEQDRERLISETEDILDRLVAKYNET